LIICGTQSWSQEVDKASRDPLKFSNVAYTLHFYAATHRESLRNKAKMSRVGKCAVYLDLRAFQGERQTGGSDR